ncbi:MAG: amidohydrolase [Candidatus Sabulitectum sp.]|nr:amidohydrolase [Candidatus Sabulitectum sp.]
MKNAFDEKQLIKLRHNLHREPELSGREENTAKTLIAFLQNQRPDLLVTSIGGHGILAVYKGEVSGRTVLLRCDMDALPINEDEKLEYRSMISGVSHKCGHDGHMAIMCGVAKELAVSRPMQGTVILLFQPAEETGQGAVRILKQLKYLPDQCFALHNLPGFQLGSVITKVGPFAGASRGMIVKLTGKSSHAAEPQCGNSPAAAVASIIFYLERICDNSTGTIGTVVHVRIGEVAFGTSPEDATVMITLRAPDAKEMDFFSNRVSEQVIKTAEEEHLMCNIHWTEEFPATSNSEFSTSIINASADHLGYKVTALTRPFLWSEDFGHFTDKFSGAMFALGAGLNTPALHSSDYDFPDNLIPVGVAMFMEILERSLKL